MTWNVIQSALGSGTGSSGVGVTYSSSVSAGTKLIVAVTGNASSFGATITAKDGAGNTFTQLALVHGSAGFGSSLALFALDTPAGDVGTTPTITVTTAGTLGIAVLIQEVSGLVTGNTTAMLDGTPATVQESTAASQAQPSYSSTASGEYLVAVFGDNGGPETWTVPSGYTADSHSRNNSNSGDVVIAYANSTGAAESGTWSFTGTLTGGAYIVVAFLLAPPPQFPRNMLTAQPGYRPRWAPALRGVKREGRFFQPAWAQAGQGVQFPLWTRQAGYRPKWAPSLRNAVSRQRTFHPAWPQPNQGVQSPLWHRQPSFSPKWLPHVKLVRGRTFQPAWPQGNQGIQFPLWTRQPSFSPKWPPHEKLVRGRTFQPGWPQGNQGVQFPLWTSQPGWHPRWAPHIFRVKRTGEFFLPGAGQAAQGTQFPLQTRQSRPWLKQVPSRRARIWQAPQPAPSAQFPFWHRQARHLPAVIRSRQRSFQGALVSPPLAPASAFLSGTGTLIAWARSGPNLNNLWAIYLAAALNAAQLRANWKLIRSVAATDGTGGRLYAQLYEAEQAAETAHLAWQAAYKIFNPAPPG